MKHQTEEMSPGSSGVNRREFLTRMGATGAAVLGVAAAAKWLWQPNHFVPGFEESAGLTLPSYAVELPKGAATLAIAHGSAREATVRAAVGALGGMERFINKHDVVVLKPNVAFDRPAVLGATTHPETLAAVARLVREAGAKEVLIADNPINSPAGCFLKSGITAVANELGLEIIYPETNAFETLGLQGEILQRWPMFHKPFRRATKVIGVAPCKDHNLCHASMTMKNWYGLLGGRRNQFHQHIHAIISDFALMIKPTLVILDGTTVLMSNGPTGGRLSDVKSMNTIIAGTDMVAVDACGCEKLLERDVNLLEYLHKAAERNLGNRNWKSVISKEVQV
jgi:uncharacterized protein (DUF362 family)